MYSGLVFNHTEPLHHNKTQKKLLLSEDSRHQPGLNIWFKFSVHSSMQYRQNVATQNGIFSSRGKRAISCFILLLFFPFVPDISYRPIKSCISFISTYLLHTNPYSTHTSSKRHMEKKITN